jgi:hypothetical protein
MTNKTAEHRLHDIYSAFDNLRSTTTGLSAVAQCTDSKAAHCTVLLLSEIDGAQVQLDVFPVGAHLIARSGKASASVGTGAIEDHLTVDLSADFNWDHAVFESPEEMAFFLLKHMRRRLLAVCDLHSDGTS